MSRMKVFEFLYILISKEAKKSSSFVQRLVTKIVDNLQVEINKVHIRFEDANKDVSAS